MSYLDYDDELVGDAPCEFCGDLYPLCLLIEHQTTHLNEDHYFGDDDHFPEVIVNERQNIEPKKAEEEKQMQSAVNKPKKVEEEKKILISGNELREVIPVQLSETSNQISDSKPNVKNDVILAQPFKASNSTIETKKKHQYKNYHSEVEEFTTEKGEKLLVYGADMVPVEDSESEKQGYKKPNNPLLSTITKEEDVIDINSLSDDDCDESLEEFWKRARDFLKRNRGKT